MLPCRYHNIQPCSVNIFEPLEHTGVLSESINLTAVRHYNLLIPIQYIPTSEMLIKEYLNHWLWHGFYVVFANADSKNVNLLKQSEWIKNTWCLHSRGVVFSWCLCSLVLGVAVKGCWLESQWGSIFLLIFELYSQGVNSPKTYTMFKYFSQYRGSFCPCMTLESVRGSEWLHGVLGIVRLSIK